MYMCIYVYMYVYLHIFLYLFIHIETPDQEIGRAHALDHRRKAGHGKLEHVVSDPAGLGEY